MLDLFITCALTPPTIISQQPPFAFLSTRDDTEASGVAGEMPMAEPPQSRRRLVFDNTEEGVEELALELEIAVEFSAEGIRVQDCEE